MPDFSDLDEYHLTILLEYCVLEHWNEVADLEYLTSLKLHKIMFETAERQDLPITRSWYLLGKYINQPEIVRREFALDFFYDPESQGIDIFSLIDDFYELYVFLKGDVSEFMDRSKIIVTNGWDYLRKIYKEQAPEPYSSCYQASIEYRKFLYDFRNYSNLKDCDVLLKNCSILTTNLHRSIKKVEEFDPFFEILIKFTDIVEDALQKTALNVRSGKSNDDHIQFLLAQDSIYFNFVWKQFAKKIAINTVTGPREGEIKQSFSDDLNDLTHQTYYIINENIEKARYLKLFLNKTDFVKTQKNQKETIEKIIEAENILQRG